MDQATATRIFDDFLVRKQAQLGEALTSTAPSPTRLIGGWAFYYQSKSYVLTGDLRSRLVGQGPVVIADDGRIIEGGSLDHNPEELLKR